MSNKTLRMRFRDNKTPVLTHAIVSLYEIRRVFHGRAPNEGEIVAIGYDRKGRPIEMIAADRPFGTVVFHAIEPPTAKVLIELGLARR